MEPVVTPPINLATVVPTPEITTMPIPAVTMPDFMQVAANSTVAPQQTIAFGVPSGQVAQSAAISSGTTDLVFLLVVVVAVSIVVSVVVSYMVSKRSR